MSSSKFSPSAPATVYRSEPPDGTTIERLEEASPVLPDISSVIECLKKQVAIDRVVHIKKRMEENRQKLSDVTSGFCKLSLERKNHKIVDADRSVDLLTKRQKDAIDMQNGIDRSNGENDSSSSQEGGHAPSAILLGSSIAVKNAVRPIKLSQVKKLPPYTTWIFLDRNQRMTEDQSVLGRRRIYYDQTGGEALICSDSEEEAIDDDEEKREFVDSEDYILRMTIKEFGLSDAVLDILAHCLSRKSSEIKARYEVLIKRDNVGGYSNGHIEGIANSFLDKDLDAALDSFDNLFCRRCLVFDCRLHGCSQDLIFPAEKQLPWSCSEEENAPCGRHCYRLVLMSEGNATPSSPRRVNPKETAVLSSGAGAPILRGKSVGPSLRKRAKACQSESASSNARNLQESSDSEIRSIHEVTMPHHSSSPPKSKLVEKSGIRKRNSKRIVEQVLVAMRKRQKKMASDSDSLASGSLGSREMHLRSNSRKESEETTSSSQKVRSPSSRRSRRKESPVVDGDKLVQVKVPDCLSKEIICDDTFKKEEFVDENIYKQDASEGKSWKPIEKALFEKGVEIFGRSSCLIARNLMNGMKTCCEVFQLMNGSEMISQLQDGTSLVEGCSKVDGNENVGGGLRRRSRFLRRRGRVRRLKYTWKSAGYHSIRKRISERKDQPCRQYNPCGCQSACGKECPCLVSGTCCEKYCGCPRSCKNRFRGCHCAKSQCRSRQCPCFAAGRECDPDVCRNCWISCGDGTLGVPWQRGDNNGCRNMKLLLKQQQRVLLGRSDVSGWGAFLKNSVSKHEYLGEYTGELISHREADKRGKIYDRENSSFLFNLNDQYVLDAFRKGDKLKFANHSPDPNCYAKVIMVAGDHRVGIFAKERICGGEELFYDYRYEPDRAPAWARKPEASGSRKEEVGPSSGRAKKIA
ncbi:hypothetical protein LguiA_017567 [Lonicera macranthoides]